MIRASSFISNFKKYNKRISSFAAPVIFLCILFLCHKLLWYVLVDDTESYTRITIHEMYNQEETIDVLFLGSSHCYRSLDPQITDDIFKANTFNAGTSSQRWDGSYALLVEAGKQYELKKVYVEMYYDMAGTNYYDRTDLTSTYIISDYMKPSLNRVSYLLTAGNSDYWINGFFPERRNWRKIFKKNYISELIAKKNTDNYKNYEYWGNPDTDEEYYSNKGYVANIGTKENNNYSHKGKFEPAYKTLSEDDAKSLENIIKYCRTHDIELVFFSTPSSNYRLLASGSYDLYVRQLTDFFADYNIPYYDFNLCKEDYFSGDSSLFKDTNHLNMEGAQKFSELFARFFCGEIKEEDLFHTSFEEKINSSDECLYGLIYYVEYVGDTKIYSFDAVQNSDFPYYASVSKKVEDSDEFKEIQSIGELGSVSVPEDETGMLKITVFSDRQGQNMISEITFEY